MGKNIPNMVASNGTIKRLLVRKSGNQSRHERVTAVRVAAARSNYQYFAMRSTRITLPNGDVRCLKDVCRIYKVQYLAVLRRLKRGMDISSAILEVQNR